MATAIDIARYLIDLAEHGEEPDPLTSLRLQKLLYYVQGWSLAIRNRPIFDETIEAWALGPVVPVVKRAFDRFLTPTVPQSEGAAETSLSNGDAVAVRLVWGKYKDYSASGLVTKTHGEAPWREARGGLPPGARSSREITRESMQRYFGGILESEWPGSAILDWLRGEPLSLEDVEATAPPPSAEWREDPSWDSYHEQST